MLTAVLGLSVVPFTWGQNSCDAVTQCINDPSCHNCLRELSSFSGTSVTALRSINIEQGFFTVLTATPDCTSTVVTSDLLRQTLHVIANDTLRSCRPSWIASPSGCQLVEYTCFTDSDCRECLRHVYSSVASRAPVRAALQSSSCQATNQSLLMNLALGPAACQAYPSCTYSKMICEQTPGCQNCWRLVQQGHLETAVSECSVPETQSALTALMSTCVLGTELVCNFFRIQCETDPVCGSCLRSLGYQPTISSIVAGSSSRECQRVFQRPIVTVLTLYMDTCPESIVGVCEAEVFSCVSAEPACMACVNGSVSGPSCDAFYGPGGYSIDASCAQCTPTIHTINAIVLATSVVGVVSVVASIAVALIILSRDTSLRDRILLGVLAANAVYSSANAVPVNRLKYGAVVCGQFEMSLFAIRIVRAWWFGGKYALVCFEIFVVLASTWALLHAANSLPRRIEAFAHAACALCGVVAFVGFYVKCAEINSAAPSESGLERDTHTYLSVTDDRDDDNPGEPSANRFDDQWAQYNQLEQIMLQVWLGVLGIAIVLWLYLRYVYHGFITLWSRAVDATNAAEAEDVWAATRRGQWQANRELLLLRKDACAEIFLPLEPYVVVFMLFLWPAAVMATDWCESESGVDATSTHTHVSTSHISVGTCNVWCEFVLSFRSLATVAVFLSSKTQRAQLQHPRDVVRRLWSRVLACLVPNLQDHGKHALIPDKSVGDMAWKIDAGDVAMERRLAEGSFGIVWIGTLKSVGAVAIKVLKMNDELGFLDPDTATEFQQECEMLQRVNHPNLLKFHGFGTLPSEQGFIVTELMGLGSLRDVLEDTTHELPWDVRVSIAHKLALGMAHLHSISIIHRDLKSANALLDHEYTAKVADFGSSRLLRPFKPTVIYSSFTGTTRAVSSTAPALENVKSGSRDHSVPSLPPHLAVGVVDTHGTLTKAVGTLLWMAPEIFRGDMMYGPAVDVYSFGIILVCRSEFFPGTSKHILTTSLSLRSGR